MDPARCREMCCDYFSLILKINLDFNNHLILNYSDLIFRFVFHLTILLMITAIIAISNKKTVALIANL